MLSSDTGGGTCCAFPDLNTENYGHTQNFYTHTKLRQMGVLLLLLCAIVNYVGAF